MMMEQTCLCKATIIKVQSLANKLGACHCTMCRKWSGGPFLTVESKESVTFSPQENVKVFSSSEWAERGFCKECGTHLFYRLKGKDHYYLPAGLFEDIDFKFDHQVFIDEKPEYYHFSEETQNLTGQQVFELFGDGVE